MKRIILLLATMLAAALAASEVALSLPSETPDDTPMVDGTVRTIDQVGGNVWVGGNFTQVKQRNGTVLDNVQNVAVLDSVTGQYRSIAPRLGGTGSLVFDIDVYGNNVVIAGKFTGPTSAQKNLVVVDGVTGAVVKWYNAPSLTTVLAAPQLGRIYGGGKSLSAFQIDGGSKPLWTRATTTVNPDLRSHNTTNGYRDLELDGSTIWAACVCDAVNGNPSKALIKLDTEGNHDVSWVADAGTAAFGISVVEANGALYLGAGGNDYLAEYSKASANRAWTRDTSGSAQVVEVMDGRLVVGGHFWEIADQPGDRCGFRSSNNGATLDLFGECQTRKGLASYTFNGALDPDFDPVYSGKYNLVWALRVDDLDPGKLHTGGEFTKVSGVTQTYYARLSSVLP